MPVQILISAPKHKLSSTCIRLLWSAFVLVIWMFRVTPGYSQELPAGWSPPVSIFRTAGSVASTPMALVPDQMGRVHLLFPHQPDEDTATGIDYMLWDGVQWSPPVNVLVNPDGSSSQVVRAAIGQDDMIHVIWLGGNNRLYYSSAAASQAGSAHSWLTPEPIAEALPTEAGIAVAPDGSVWVAYADAIISETISLVGLEAGRGYWTNAATISTSERDVFPGEVGLVIDDQGRMHLTWTTILKPDAWPPTGVYYARSLDHGETWEARRIAGGDYGQAGVAVPSTDEVHVFWSSTVGGDGTFHQWSLDGGETWSNPSRFIERGGFSGLPSFGVDSTDNLHYLRGSAVYAEWGDGNLSPVQTITSDEVCQQGKISCGERAMIALTTGNRLHAVFETDFNQLWYTFRELDAPETSGAITTPAAVDSIVIAPGTPAISAIESDTSVAPNEFATNRIDEVGPVGSALEGLILSMLPPALFIVAVVMYFTTRKSRRR